MVFFGSDDHKVYALKRLTGALVWNYTTGSWVNSSPAIGENGIVYVGSDDFNVYALDGSTGTLLWKYTTAGPVSSTPAVGAGGHVFIGSWGSEVYALDGWLGIVKWKSITDVMFATSSPALAVAVDDTVLVGMYAMNSAGYSVRALNGSTGALVWNWTTGFVSNSTAEGSILSSPALASDGTVYVGCEDGKVYALQTPLSPRMPTQSSPYSVSLTTTLAPSASGSQSPSFAAISSPTQSMSPPSLPSKWYTQSVSVSCTPSPTRTHWHSLSRSQNALPTESPSPSVSHAASVLPSSAGPEPHTVSLSAGVVAGIVTLVVGAVASAIAAVFFRARLAQTCRISGVCTSRLGGQSPHELDKQLLSKQHCAVEYDPSGPP